MKRLSLLIICLLLSISQASMISAYSNYKDETLPGVFHSPDNNDLSIKIIDNINKLQLDSSGLTNLNFESEINLTNVKVKELNLVFELSKLSDNGYYLELVDKNNEMITLKDSLDNRQPIRVNSLKPGNYELNVSIQSVQSEHLTLGSKDSKRFTVHKSGEITFGWDKDMPNITPATAQSGELASVYSDPLSNDYGIYDINEWSDKRNKDSVSALASVTLTGKWTHYNRNQTITSALKKARVEVLYRDQFYIWRTAALTTTDSNGNWSVSYSTPNNHNLWEVRVTSTNTSYGTVENSSGNTYSSYTQYLDLSNGGNIGTWNVTSGTYTDYAFWVWSDMVRTKDAISIYRDPGNSTIVWPSGNGAYYTRGGKIHLGSYAHASSTITIHELGHNYMYNIYGSMPSTSCPSPHYFHEESEPGCAWTEGWASFLAFYMNNSPVYEYYGGGSINLENTSSFENKGDSVEGLVLGSLWDLYDSNVDGDDNVSYSFASIYRTMYTQKINSTSEYWSKWKDLGYSSTAKNAFKQNRIIYN